jgi:hypothetical protein
MEASAMSCEHMREQLQELLDNAPKDKLARMLKQASVTKRRRVRKSKYKRPTLAQWTPRHPAETKEAIQLMQDGAGVRTCPFPVLDPVDGQWRHKFFGSDVALAIMRKSGREDNKSTRATCSLAVSGLAKRIVEEAAAIKAGDETFDTAKMAMQRSGDDPGWDKLKTKGSGVVFDEDGKQLFEMAVKRVAARLEAV